MTRSDSPSSLVPSRPRHAGLASLLRAAAAVLVLGALAAPALRAEPASPPPAGQKPAARIDVNTASEADLQSLPRIGPALAKRIVEYRKQVGTIKSVDELVNVKGIGDKMLEVIRPFVVVSNVPAPAAPGKKQ
jgi:competence protein ComEA